MRPHALIDKKHVIQRRVPGVQDKEFDGHALLQIEFDEASRAAARAVRAESRQRLAGMAKEAEAADAVMNMRKIHGVIRRLAPKPAATVVAVCNPVSGD
eukprot:4785512-Pyramimonas_sp.AAC.1